MVAIEADEPLQRPARVAGIARGQCVEQRVDRRGLCAVEEQIELDMFAGVAKPGAQQCIQHRIGRCGQNGSGVLLPAMMHRRFGGQTERIGPRSRAVEPHARLRRPVRQHRIQGLETTLRARPGSPPRREDSSPAAAPAAHIRPAPSRAAERRLVLARCERSSSRPGSGWGCARTRTQARVIWRSRPGPSSGGSGLRCR